MKNTMHNEQVSIISLCPVEPSHENFLLKLFTECRPDLALIIDVSKKQKASIISQQFTMEQQQLIQMYPDAELNIVMFNKEPVGRLYVHHGETADRILEIGLLEQYRGRGIGGKLVTTVIENAAKIGKTVRLQVVWFNQGAYAFYEKVGFQVIENRDVFYEMQYMY